MEQEIWKEIPYAKDYLVSSSGGVKSKKYGTDLKLRANQKQEAVTLYVNRKKQIHLVPNLVFDTFIGTSRKYGHFLLPAKKRDSNRGNSVENIYVECFGAEHVSLDVPGYPPYRVTKEGQFYSPKYGARFLKQQTTIHGYLHVTLTVNGKCSRLISHRLVAAAFIPNPENKPQVNHKNGIKTDNRVENLEWVTASENLQHSINVLNNKYGKKTLGGQRGKLKEDDVMLILKMIHEGKSNREIAKIFDVHRATIASIRRKNTWKQTIIKYEKSK